VDRSIIKEDIGAFGKLRAELRKTFDNSRCVHFSFDHRGHERMVAFQKTSHIQALPMIRSRYGNDVTNRLPRIGNTRGEAKACDITIPEGTDSSGFLLLSVVNEPFAPLILVWIRRFGRRLLEPFPDIAFFFEPFDSLGTDAFGRLLL